MCAQDESDAASSGGELPGRQEEDSRGRHPLERALGARGLPQRSVRASWGR